jgi:5-aminolevulinate synthase
VIGAMVDTATRMGTGAERHPQYRRHPSSAGRARAADLHGKEAALVFIIGYVLNGIGISTVVKLMPNCPILPDAGTTIR